jgi:hypothetical protein
MAPYLTSSVCGFDGDLVRAGRKGRPTGPRSLVELVELVELASNSPLYAPSPATPLPPPAFDTPLHFRSNKNTSAIAATKIQFWIGRHNLVADGNCRIANIRTAAVADEKRRQGTDLEANAY